MWYQLSDMASLFSPEKLQPGNKCHHWRFPVSNWNRESDMPKVTLTAARIEALKPRRSPYDIRDARLKGFGVRVMPTGRKRFFIQCQHRGERVWKIVGDAGAMSIDEARASAAAAGRGHPASSADRLPQGRTPHPAMARLPGRPSVPPRRQDGIENRLAVHARPQHPECAGPQGPVGVRGGAHGPAANLRLAGSLLDPGPGGGTAVRHAAGKIGSFLLKRHHKIDCSHVHFTHDVLQSSRIGLLVRRNGMLRGRQPVHVVLDTAPARLP